MEYKETAVSWLVEQLAMENGSFHAIAFYNENQDIIQQAKAMEKEQRKNAYLLGFLGEPLIIKHFDGSYTKIECNKL